MNGTFVSFGNLKKPFYTLAALIINNADLLPKPIIVQAGASFHLFDLPIKDLVLFDRLSQEKYDEYLKSSKVFLAHAGVGSISKALEFGKFPAIVPRSYSNNEHIDDHQLELVKEFRKMNIFFLVLSSKSLEKYIKNGTFTQAKDAFFFTNESLSRHCQNYILTLIGK